jgi:hypothetical protein
LPYFEIGTEVEFTAADKLPLEVKALQNQYLGVVGHQYIAANVAQNIADALNNFTTQNLQDIATYIAQYCSNTVKYMKVSWNMGANNHVTDFVIGCVIQITAVPNNGADLINAIHSGPLGYITDAFPSFGYDAYIIGNPAGNTIPYVQTFSAATTDWLSLQTLLDNYGTEEHAIEELRNHFVNNIAAKLVEGYAHEGIIGVTVKTAEITDVHLEKKLGVVGLQKALGCRFWISAKITLDSTTQLHTHSITLIVLAIGWTIAAIVIGLAAVAMIGDWLKSMTTSTVTSTETVYGWRQNPGTGEWEWVPVSTKTETETNPDLGGIWSIGMIIAIIVGVGLLIVLGIFASKRKEGG